MSPQIARKQSSADSGQEQRAGSGLPIAFERLLPRCDASSSDTCGQACPLVPCCPAGKKASPNCFAPVRRWTARGSTSSIGADSGRSGSGKERRDKLPFRVGLIGQIVPKIRVHWQLRYGGPGGRMRSRMCSNASSLCNPRRSTRRWAPSAIEFGQQAMSAHPDLCQPIPMSTNPGIRQYRRGVARGPALGIQALNTEARLCC